MTDAPAQSTGSFKLATGEVFQGQYIKTESGVIVPHGQGTLLASSGDLFVGQFNQGKRAHGSVLYSNGATYTGHFDLAETPSGEGVYKWTDGRTYRGFFMNGRPHGPGLYEGFLASSVETVFRGISVSGDFSSNTQETLTSRFLAQYESQYVEAARGFLRTLAADLESLIPGGSSDANPLAPSFIAKHLLAVQASPQTSTDPWVVGGLATDVAKSGETKFVTLRQLRLRIPAVRKLLERIDNLSVRCLKTPPAWGVEQLRHVGQVVEIGESETGTMLRFVNVGTAPDSGSFRLVEMTGGEATGDEGTAIAAIFNEKKKKK